MSSSVPNKGDPISTLGLLSRETKILTCCLDECEHVVRGDDVFGFLDRNQGSPQQREPCQGQWGQATGCCKGGAKLFP